MEANNLAMETNARVVEMAAKLDKLMQMVENLTTADELLVRLNAALDTTEGISAAIELDKIPMLQSEMVAPPHLKRHATI